MLYHAFGGVDKLLSLSLKSERNVADHQRDLPVANTPQLAAYTGSIVLQQCCLQGLAFLGLQRTCTCMFLHVTDES